MEWLDGINLIPWLISAFDVGLYDGSCYTFYNEKRSNSTHVSSLGTKVTSIRGGRDVPVGRLKIHPFFTHDTSPMPYRVTRKTNFLVALSLRSRASRNDLKRKRRSPYDLRHRPCPEDRCRDVACYVSTLPCPTIVDSKNIALVETHR
jgi:hypothetical protein